jgi:hypothetical protein
VPWFRTDPKQRQLKRQQEEEEFNQTLEVILPTFRKRRTIVCPDVAILVVENHVSPQEAGVFAAFAPLIGLGKLFTSEKEAVKEEQQEAAEQAKRDAQIANILAAVLSANPQADLSHYEQTFKIKIIHIDLIKKPESTPEPAPPKTRYIDI